MFKNTEGGGNGVASSALKARPISPQEVPPQFGVFPTGPPSAPKPNRGKENLSRQWQSRFYEMLENVSLIAMTLDTRGRVTFCNDYLLKLTGWKRTEIIGANWFENFLPEAEAHLKTIFFEKVERGELPAHHENAIRTKSGELRDIVWKQHDAAR